MTSDKSATARKQREWLRALPELTGLSLAGIAKAISVARSTLSDKVKADDPGISVLRSDTIDKICAKFGVPPPGGDVTIGFGEDATPYVSEKNDPLANAVKALIAGRNGIDPWTLKSRALELIGFLPGDIVLVDLNASPQPGDPVCAQIYEWNRMKAETVMRVLERASPVDLLATRSLDPALQSPVVVDGERVVIKGVLLPHRLRAQPQAA